jgi:beta-glucanase (GH16 family)
MNLKRLFLAVFLLTVISFGCFSQTLVWSDEFEGTGVPDPDKWERMEYNRKNNDSGPDGWWLKEDAYLNGEGNLIIRVKRIPNRNDDSDAFDYSCGAIRTLNKYEKLYGRFEMRAKLPTQQGWWVAFWMMLGDVSAVGNGGVDGAEVDIMESFGWKDHVYHTVHWDGYGADHQAKAAYLQMPGIREGYHTYALDWTPDEYIFYVDGEVTFRTSAGGVCNQPGYLKVTGEIASYGFLISEGWSNDPAEAEYPDSFMVDYVRVYDLDIEEEEETDEFELTAVEKTDVQCLDDGSATVQVSGGVSPYTYLWSNGQTSQTATNLVPGEYSVNVIDSENDTVKGSVVIGGELVVRGYWSFIEGAGDTTEDLSGNGSTGNLFGEPLWVEGTNTGALSFDGVDDYVECSSSSLDFSSEFSIYALFTPSIAGETADGNTGIAAQATESEWAWQLRYKSPDNNYLGFQFNTESGSYWATVKQNLDPGTWYQVIGTYDGTYLRCYLDGVKVDSVLLSDISTSEVPILIGQEGWSQFFNGIIDEFKIFNRALCDKEIDDLNPSTEKEVDATDIAGLGIESSIKVYPNPVSDKVFIVTEGLDISNAKCMITDISGKIVYDNNILSNNELIELGNFNPGIYFVEVSIQDELVIYKLLKK